MMIYAGFAHVEPLEPFKTGLTYVRVCLILHASLRRGSVEEGFIIMERDRDSLGRKRQPDQERGLRPLHPLLPSHWMSKVLRVAMSRDDWDRFDGLVRSAASRTQPLTQARAHGEALSRLMDEAAATRATPGPLDWMDWERQKTLRLLRSAV